MAQIPLPDALLARLRQVAQQDELSLPLLFEQMLDLYLHNRVQGKERDDFDVVEKDRFDPIDREVAAYEALHASLLKRYANQYVAIYQGKLIDHDSNKLALFQRIEEKYPNEFVLMRPVQEQPEREFYFRSPRYIERV
ncbi:MAG TPA: DUF5678 domain-containing protein [Caldilineaceae bacterium]|nr:DUF5678 domain-containing protein [Caldilineaceae bacterium]